MPSIYKNTSGHLHTGTPHKASICKNIISPPCAGTFYQKKSLVSHLQEHFIESSVYKNPFRPSSYENILWLFHLWEHLIRFPNFKGAQGYIHCSQKSIFYSFCKIQVGLADWLAKSMSCSPLSPPPISHLPLTDMRTREFLTTVATTSPANTHSNSSTYQVAGACWPQLLCPALHCPLWGWTASCTQCPVDTDQYQCTVCVHHNNIRVHAHCADILIKIKKNLNHNQCVCTQNTCMSRNI